MPSGATCKHCGFSELAHKKKSTIAVGFKQKVGFRISLMKCPGYETDDIATLEKGDRLRARFGKARLVPVFGIDARLNPRPRQLV